ncbi:hypothetical protein ACWEQ7_26180 [Streptomyces sp. NPDC004069]
MSKQQVRKMLELVRQGQPVELTIPMGSVKKAAKLSFVAQQFGYEYADARLSGGRNNVLTLLLVPDPGPQAQARAAQNWAQYPNAGDGVSLPPLVPDALELLKARINFDLTDKSAEKRMVYGALGVTVGCVILAVRLGADASAFLVAASVWAGAMVLLGIGVLVTRKRHAKFAARLGAAGFVPVTQEDGRVRYLPSGAQVAGQAAQAGPYGHGPYNNGAYNNGPYSNGPYGQPYSSGPYAAPQAPHPQAYPQPGPYTPPQPPGPYHPQ